MAPSSLSAVAEATTNMGASALPDVTVVLLVHNPTPWDVETARLVRSQGYPARIITLVIDSSSNPNGECNVAMRRVADVWQSIPEGSFGHGSTRNLAVEWSSTPITAFISQDAHPASEGWLVALVRPLAEGRAHASYGRQLVLESNAERQATFSFLYPDSGEVKSKDRLRELGLRTFHFSDVTSAFLTEVVRRVQFPAHLRTFEDIGVAKRLLDAGYLIAYVPEASVFHAHHMRLKEMAKRYFDIGEIYERLGIFAELKKVGRRSLLAEGFNSAKAVTPGPQGSLPALIQTIVIGALKGAAVILGRVRTRVGRLAKPTA
jgi:hypothetical protein